MPELPEVESVRRGLQQHLPGSRIITIEQHHPRALAADSIAPLDLLNGLIVDQVRRRGKYLWVTFRQDEHVLIAHLGMSGQFRVFEGKEALKDRSHPHTRVSLQLLRSRRRIRVEFLDQRTFGWMRVDRTADQDPRAIPISIQHVARDPFESEFDALEVIERLRKKKTQIKRAILDQRTISGVGNIYADEALWRAKIHPERLATKLSEDELRRLLTSIRAVMSKALDSGGTSFDHLYVNVNGESGYFATKLAVYGREGERCRRCGARVKRIAFTNRSSHFCPRCQRSR